MSLDGHLLSSLSLMTVEHRGSVRASHPAAPGSNLDTSEISDLDSQAECSEQCVAKKVEWRLVP